MLLKIIGAGSTQLVSKTSSLVPRLTECLVALQTSHMPRYCAQLIWNEFDLTMYICKKLLLLKKKIICFNPITPFSLSLISWVAASAHRYSSGMWQETTVQLASWQGRGGLPTATHWLECVLGSGRQMLLQYALPGEIHPQKSWLVLKCSQISRHF